MDLFDCLNGAGVEIVEELGNIPFPDPEGQSEATGPQPESTKNIQPS
jgi:hypothetical protein